MLQHAVRTSDPKDCDKHTTVDCVRALYNFNYEIVSADKNALAVREYIISTFLLAHTVSLGKNSRG